MRIREEKGGRGRMWEGAGGNHGCRDESETANPAMHTLQQHLSLPTILGSRWQHGERQRGGRIRGCCRAMRHNTFPRLDALHAVSNAAGCMQSTQQHPPPTLKRTRTETQAESHTPMHADCTHTHTHHIISHHITRCRQLTTCSVPTSAARPMSTSLMQKNASALQYRMSHAATMSTPPPTHAP
jgi:hypothetical protein